MESLNNKNTMRDGGRSNLATANNNNYYAAGRDYLGRFSWPPRPYTCSFCKREFRSAQALGGHMNVHRRDRARLRQSPPPLDNHQPAAHPPPPPKIITSNPNFIINSSSSSSPSSAKNQFPPSITYTSTYPPHPMLMSSTTTPSSVPTLADDHHEKKPTTVVLCSTIDPSSSKYCRDELTKKHTSVMKRSTTTSLLEVEDLNQGFIHEDDNCCKNLMKEVAAEISVTLDLEIGLSCKDDLDLELRLGYS